MKAMFKLFVFCMVATMALIQVKAEGENPGVRVTFSGYVKDSDNGEVLIGVNVYMPELKIGTVTNAYGFYSISVQPGNYKVTFSYLGFKTIEKQIELKSNISLNLELSTLKRELEEVVITAERPEANVKQAEMSVNKLDNMAIKKIPALMGEVDILKTIQMLPGVLPTAEGTSGFSVRGGNMDQNLIVLDEATVYNASHLMGFFSVFNNDAIRDIKLYKGDIPPMYGGRLSSVLDVKMKEGNAKKFAVTGGIGLISSRLTVEGPIGKNHKTSFLISGRRTYADLFFPLMSDSGVKKSTMYFYDFNLKVNHQLNQNNRFYLSAYLGRDKFGQKNSSDAGFGNKTATLRWNHLFSEKLFLNVSAVMSQYDYSLEMKMGGSDYVWNSKMRDYTAKADFNFYLNPENEIKFGVSSTYHDFDPCEAYIQGVNNRLSVPYPKNYALEHGFYLGNQQKIGDKLTLKYGFRYSIFQNIGSGTLYKFDDYRVTDSLYYSSGNIFHTYRGFEPRIGLNFSINDNSSIKASYSHTVQYMQLASNSTGGMPLDVWFPSSPNIKPQKADQFSIGYFRNLFNNLLETSVEVYYKDMNDVIDFKDHPQLLMNPRMEGEIRTGISKAYGLEVFIKKNEGKLTGWVSYTLSKVRRKITTINDGDWYTSPYDKPNTINVIMSYEFSKRHTLSANWIFATGAPFTAPVGVFTYDNTVNKIYSKRNGYRMRDYNRLDVSFTIKDKGKPNRFWHGEWVFSMYNAYGRHNDWMLNFTEDAKNPGKIKTERWYLPFVFFPAITYNFNF